MPHELLHGYDVAPAFKKACRVCVAELVERGTCDLAILRKLLEPSQEMRLSVARFRREDPRASTRKSRKEFGKLLRNGNHPFLIVLWREPLLVAPAHAQRGVPSVPQIDIGPCEKAEFLFPQSGEQERRKDRLLERIADSEKPAQFILPVCRGTALGFRLRVLERLEFGAWVRNGQVPFADEEVEEGTEHGKLEIDGAGRDAPVGVLMARFRAADGLVIVDVGARDSVNEELPPEDALHVVEHVRVAPYRAWLVRRVHPHVVQEKSHGIREEGELRFSLLGRLARPGAEHERADQLVALPPLRLHRFARGDPRRFASALPSFPPFHEIVAGPLVPHVARPRMAQRNEPPLSVLIANLLDDPNGFLYRHIRLLGV